MDQGTRPSAVPLTSAQIQAAADPQYLRIDGANRPLHVFNNALMNPSFDWWQRGTGTFTASGAGLVYGPDRWCAGNLGSNGSVSLSRAALAFGDNPDSLSRFSLNASCTGHSAVGDGASVQQRMEGVDTFAGRRVVLKGKIRQTNGTGARVAMQLNQQFGTSGSAGVDILPSGGGSPQIALTNTLQPFSLIFDVPSMSGKILGTANDFLNLVIWLSAGSNYNAQTGGLGLQTIGIQLSDVELKELRSGYGDQFPGFERLPKFLDFLNCLRYYEQIQYINSDPIGTGTVNQNNNPVTLYNVVVFWRARKRTTPSCSGSAASTFLVAGLTPQSYAPGGSTDAFWFGSITVGAGSTGAYAALTLAANAAGAFIAGNAEL